MNRASFIHSLIAVFGIAAIPKQWVKHYNKIYLLQTFIRGFRFHNGENLLAEMKGGDILELIRESNNEFDSAAIAVFYKQQKIGYIPRESNEILSRLMDSEMLTLHCEITHLEPEAKPWENLHLAVFLLKETDDVLPDDKVYLTELDTPDYYTLGRTDNHVTRFWYPVEEHTELDGSGFYEKMVDSSKDDSVYDLLHSLDPEQMEEMVRSGRFITREADLVGRLSADEMAEIGEGKLDGDFGKLGFVNVDVEKLARMAGRIEEFVEVADGDGEAFLEVVFKGRG